MASSGSRTIVPDEPYFRQEIAPGVVFGKLYPGGKDGPDKDCLKPLPGGQTWSDFIFLGDENNDRIMAIPEIRLPANQYWPMHWHDCWTIVYIVEGTCLMGDWWMGPGDIIVVEPSIEYGPLLIGPQGCRMFEIFADRSLARGGYALEYHDHPTLQGIAAEFFPRSEINRRNEGNQTLALDGTSGMAKSTLTPGGVWNLGPNSDPERAMFKDVRLAAGEKVAPHSYADWHTIIVMDGSLQVHGHELVTDGYLLVAPGSAVGEIVGGAGGARLLEFARTAKGMDRIAT